MDLLISTISNKPGLLECPEALLGTKYDSYLLPVEHLLMKVTQYQHTIY